MILNDSSKVIHFEPQILTNDELDSLHIPEKFQTIRKNIVKINGKYYYYKKAEEEGLINELIGSYLCKLVDLDAVDYKIGIWGNQFYALSEVFYQDGFDYMEPRDYYGYAPDNIAAKLKWYIFDNMPRYKDTIGDRIHTFLPDLYFQESSLLKKVYNPQAVDDIMKTTAVDLKMGQVDRAYHANMLLRIRNGIVEIEKLFDFERSYSYDPYYPDFNYYDNPFLIVRKNTISLLSIAVRYPQLRKSAAILCDIPIYDVLKEIERINNIKIIDETMQSYLKFDKRFNRTLRKIK